MGRYGDIEVYVDDGERQREIEESLDPLCLSPNYETATKGMPERIVL